MVEYTCTEVFHTNSYDEVVPRDFVCDGVPDCSNNRDESQCIALSNEFPVPEDGHGYIRFQPPELLGSKFFFFHLDLQLWNHQGIYTSASKDDGACTATLTGKMSTRHRCVNPLDIRAPRKRRIENLLVLLVWMR